MAYQKQTFKDNETVLKAEHLNHIEDGIVALENTMNDINEVSIPNGAQVGQIIQVSKVDGSGKPTEWRAVDMPNGRNAIKFPPIMQTAPLGQLFEAPMNYTAWCPGNLRYDKNIDKYVDLIYCNDVHVNPSKQGLYITYIDPVTFKADVPIAAKYVDQDGVTEIIPTGHDGVGATNFNILSDGRYCIIKDNGDGSSMFRFISSDNGVTWVKSEAVTGILSTLYGSTVLSNGRWIGCDDVEKSSIYYSDDEGITWTEVKPETGGFDYESEACILELSENVLMAVGRKSISGVGYNTSGDAEHALISFSYDNGESWSKWTESASIDNMNASSATGFVHDGIVEIFAASRWYHRSSNAVTDYTNTGKSGAITHYVATVENALLDKFTNRGIVVYANGTGGDTSNLPAQDFHAPCLATNGIGTDFLMVYFDRAIEPYTEEATNHHFVHGSLYGFAPVEDADGRTGRTYSTKQVDALIAAAVAKLNIRIDNIEAGGDAGGGDYIYAQSGLVAHIDALNADNIANQSFTDAVTGGTFTPTAITGYTMEFAEQGVRNMNLTAKNYRGLMDNPQEMTFELCTLGSSAATNIWNIGYSKASGKVEIFRKGRTLLVCDTSSATQQSFVVNAFTWSDTADLWHGVVTLNATGEAKFYLNGKLTATYQVADFAAYSGFFNASSNYGMIFNIQDNSLGNVYFRTMRVYNRVLTEDEITVNYEYEANR